MLKTKIKRRLSALIGAVVSVFTITSFAATNMIASAATIDSLQPFSDVAYGNQYYNAARLLKNEGVIQGYPDGSLGIEKEINRAEFVKTILEAQEGVEIKYDSNFTFSDISPDAWYAKYVSTAKREGIVQGYPDGTFKPEKSIVYPEVMKVVIERFKITKGTSCNAFPIYSTKVTESKSTWFYNYLETAGCKNIFSFSYDFDPAKNITRGESFDVLYKALGLKEGMTASNSYGESYFTTPYLYLNSQNGLLVTNLKTPYRLLVSYYGDKLPKLKVKLYEATPENFLEARSSNANNFAQYNLVPDALKAKMKLVKEFETEIIKKNPTNKETGYFSYADGFIELPITKNGLYFVEIDGKFIPPQDTFIDVTDNIMMARQGTDKNVVWLMNQTKNTPVAGAKINLYRVPDTYYSEAPVEAKDSYQKVGEMTTNDKGLSEKAVKQVTQDLNYENPNYFIAEKDGDITIMQGYTYNQDYQNDTVKSFTYTDRPVYRLGDTVNFKSILRKTDQDGKYSVNLEPVSVRVMTYSGSGEVEIYRKTLTPSEYGNIEGSFNIPSSGSTGSYSFQLSPGLETGDSAPTFYEINPESSFQVEEYKKDEYQLSVTTDKERYLSGDDVKATVVGKYFFGTPVTNQKVTYNIYRQEDYYWPPCIDICPMFDYYSAKIAYFPSSYRTFITSGEGTLDEKGELNFTFNTDADTNGDYYRSPYSQNSRFIIEVTTMDSSNIPVNGTKTVEVKAAEFNLMTKQLSGVPTLKEEYQLEISSKDHDEKVYANAAIKGKITLSTYKRVQDGTYYDYWEDQSLPYYRYDYETTVVKEFSGKTDASGKYILKYTPVKGGSYTVEIEGTDSKGNTITANNSFYVYGDNEYNYNPYYGETVNVNTDKTIYSTGDTAKIHIDSSVKDGYLFLVTGTNQVLSYQVVKLNGNSYELTVPITEAMAPSFSVYAHTLSTKTNFATGQADLKVLPNNKKLTIKITPDKSTYIPQETAKFNVEVTDSNGKGVATDLSLALVDQAVLNLVNAGNEDIFWAFYQPGYSYLNFAYTPKTNLSNITAEEGKGGGSDDYAEQGEKDASAPTTGTPAPAPAREANLGGITGNEAGSTSLRSSFLDTALWVGSVKTDANGKATITAKLPDNLTTWAAAVVGNTKTSQFGNAQQRVIVTKNMIVSPQVPRFVTEGDSVTIRAVARNNNVSGSSFKLALSGEGFTGGTEKSVTIAQGQNQTLEFPIKVTGTGKLNLTFKLTSGSQNDTVSLSLPINPVGLEKITSKSGEDNATINLVAESGNAKNIKSLKLNLAPTLSDNLISSIENLVGYPYGCVEQTMSRFLPNVVVFKNRAKLNFKNQDIFKDLDAQVKAGFQRLYNYQHSDGGWGWWENDPSVPKNSAYVMYGLALAKDAGFTVDENVWNSGLKYLEGVDVTGENKKFEAYVNYVLSIVDSGYAKGLNFTSPQTDSTADLAYTAMMLQNIGKTTEAKALLKKLTDKVTTQGDLAYFDEEVIDYEMMSSDTLTTAVALEALVQIDPENALIPKLIRYLNLNNQSYYGETHSTAHAVIAIANYIVKTSQVNPDYTYEVKLNGKSLASGKLDQMKELEIPVKDLKTDGNTITITKNGTGKLYYTLVQKEFLGQSNVSASNNGFKVERSYYNESGKKITGAIKAGDIVRVGIKVKSTTEAYYTMIEDKLPAGLEAVNTNLSKDSCNGGGGYPIPYVRYEGDMAIMPPTGNDGICSFYQGDYTDHQDLLDDRVAMFRTNLPAGDYEFSYFARAVTPGTYQANPAVTNMMYAPEINGNSASGTITIQ